MSRPKLEPTLACCPPPCSQRFLSPIPARTGRKEKLQLAPSFPLCSKSVPETRWGRRPPAGAFSERWDLAAVEDEARAPEKKEAGAAPALHGAACTGGCSRRCERCRAWGRGWVDGPSLQHVALMRWELQVSALLSVWPGSGCLCSMSPQISWRSPQARGLHHGPMTRRKKTLGTLSAYPLLPPCRFSSANTS